MFDAIVRSSVRLCGGLISCVFRYDGERLHFVGHHNFPPAALDIYQRLLKSGVIVRPMTSFGMESALRISIGTPEENRRLIKALRNVLGEGRAGGEGKHV